MTLAAQIKDETGGFMMKQPTSVYILWGTVLILGTTMILVLMFASTAKHLSKLCKTVVPSAKLPEVRGHEAVPYGPSPHCLCR